MLLNDLISHALTASDVALNKYQLSLCFGKSDPQKINACTLWMKRRLSVTNLSSESNLPMIWLNACSSCHQDERMSTEAFSRNVGKLFSELKLITFSWSMQKPTEKPLKVHCGYLLFAYNIGIQWNPSYNGHHWEPTFCPLYRGCPLLRGVCGVSLYNILLWLLQNFLLAPTPNATLGSNPKWRQTFSTKINHVTNRVILRHHADFRPKTRCRRRRPRTPPSP